MIDLKDLRDRPEHYRTGIGNKHGDPASVDSLLEADAKLRSLITEQQTLTAEKNAIGKQIGQLAGRLKKVDADQKATLEAAAKEARAKLAAASGAGLVVAFPSRQEASNWSHAPPAAAAAEEEDDLWVSSCAIA